MKDYGWDKDTSPESFLFSDEKIEKNFNQLRLSASVSEIDGHTPWSDTYWPGYQGGIANRYLDPGHPNPFRYLSPRKEDLLKMSQDEILKLSPAEKFDILRGYYDYPLLKRVRNVYSPNTESWVGICHGWTPAASNFPEPKSVTVMNPDGIVIPFASSDVKGILSFYYAWEASQIRDDGTENFGVDKTKITKNNPHGYWQRDPKMIHFIYKGLGNRTYSKKEGRTGKVDNRGDLNPGVLHLLLTNLMGRYHRAFNADIDKGAEVWNQPLYGYQSKVITKQSSEFELLVETNLYYVSELDPSFKPHLNQQLIKIKPLKYWLYLDAQKNIVGGKWVKENKILGIPIPGTNQTELLDFIWRGSRVPFLGEFNALNDIYKTEARTTTSYASGPGYTPGLIDVDGEEIVKDKN